MTQPYLFVRVSQVDANGIALPGDRQITSARVIITRSWGSIGTNDVPLDVSDPTFQAVLYDLGGDASVGDTLGFQTEATNADGSSLSEQVNWRYKGDGTDPEPKVLPKAPTIQTGVDAGDETWERVV